MTHPSFSLIMENRLPQTNLSQKNNRYATAIRALGLMYIFSSLVHIATLSGNKDWYFHLYGYMPPWLATARYCFSWFQRILGISAGIGLLFLSRTARWTVLGISAFTVLTLYWKHPYSAFLQHMKDLDAHYGADLFGGLKGISFESLTVPAMIGNYAADIVFCAAVVYFLTRPQVKRLFYE